MRQKSTYSLGLNNARIQSILQMGNREEAQNILKPLFRWAGSKRQLLPLLQSLTKNCEFKRIVEPFCGSAAFTFHVEPNDFLLSDQNDWLVNTYITIRNAPEAFFDILTKIPFEDKVEYYRIRELAPDTDDKILAAAQFAYLNQHCFNGIFRTNKEGKFNVPYSGSKTPSKKTIQSLLEFSAFLRRGKIVQGDFESVVKKNLRKTDLVYLDPPYVTKRFRIFGEYTATVFSEQDLQRLSNTLEFIHRRGAKFVLSYQKMKEMKQIASCWKVHRQSVKRKVSAKVSSRKTVHEIVVTNIGF
jgi:DNA adenine methylase